MLDGLSTLAIVPKAKAIAARRLTKSEYEALARKRSVIEVTAALQAHPSFKKCLAGVSQTNLHRAQLEEALRKDIFFKYESLMRYSFRKGHFGAYFLMRCEIDELLTKLRLLSMGFHHHYIVHLPGFLADKTSFSLLRWPKRKRLPSACRCWRARPMQRCCKACCRRRARRWITWPASTRLKPIITARCCSLSRAI